MRGRWALHELGLIALGFVMPLDKGAAWRVLAEDRTQLVAMVAAAGLLVLRAARSRWRMPRLHGPVAAVWRPLVLYVAVLGVATCTRSLPSERVALYFPLVVVLVGVWVCEAYRPGSFHDVVYRVGVLHLIAAVAWRTTEVSGFGVDRLTGGTHPVLLGLEAAGVFIIAWTRWTRRAGAWPRLSLAVCGLALGVLAAAFSRTALISFTVAVVFAAVYRGRPRLRPAKAAFAVGCAVIAYGLVSGPILDLLGGTAPESLANASGRYQLWSDVIGHNDQWLRGYGFAALRDPDGPDIALYRVTGGLPAESSPLQALLMAGVAGAGLWCWFAWRAGRELWQRRDTASGATVFFGIIVAVEAIYGVGMSGVSYTFWWVLAAVSLVEAVSTGSVRTTVSANVSGSRSAREPSC